MISPNCISTRNYVKFTTPFLYLFVPHPTKNWGPLAFVDGRVAMLVVSLLQIDNLFFSAHPSYFHIVREPFRLGPTAVNSVFVACWPLSLCVHVRVCVCLCVHAYIIISMIGLPQEPQGRGSVCVCVCVCIPLCRVIKFAQGMV